MADATSPKILSPFAAAFFRSSKLVMRLSVFACIAVAGVAARASYSLCKNAVPSLRSTCSYSPSQVRVKLLKHRLVFAAQLRAELVEKRYAVVAQFRLA